MLLSKNKLSNKNTIIVCISYLLILLVFASTYFFKAIINDIKYPYSSAKEIANYINENLEENTTILIDASIIGQTIIPYLDTAKFYDITYKEMVDCANVAFIKNNTVNALKNLDSSYSGNYLIVCNNLVDLEYEVLFETKNAIINEKYTLYYIK